MLRSGRPRFTRTIGIAAVMLACAVPGACGKSSKPAVSPRTSSATTTTSAATGGSGTTNTAAPGTEDVWRTTAAEHRGQNGKRFTLECTPNGKAVSIWGVETYTDDSSICTAAVHVGLIALNTG